MQLLFDTVYVHALLCQVVKDFIVKARVWAQGASWETKISIVITSVRWEKVATHSWRPAVDLGNVIYYVYVVVYCLVRASIILLLMKIDKKSVSDRWLVDELRRMVNRLRVSVRRRVWLWALTSCSVIVSFVCLRIVIGIYLWWFIWYCCCSCICLLVNKSALGWLGSSSMNVFISLLVTMRTFESFFIRISLVLILGFDIWC